MPAPEQQGTAMPAPEQQGTAMPDPEQEWEAMPAPEQQGEAMPVPDQQGAKQTTGKYDYKVSKEQCHVVLGCCSSSYLIPEFVLHQIITIRHLYVCCIIVQAS